MAQTQTRPRAIASFWLLALVLACGWTRSAPATELPPTGVPCCESVRLVGDPGQAALGDLLEVMYQRRELALKPYFNGAGAPAEAFWNEEFHFTARRDTSLLEFLCARNPHICRLTGHQATWRNQKGDAAPADLDSLDCGSPSLPPQVMCLPKVRISPYTGSLTEQINRAKVSYAKLGELVTQTLDGCTDWDAACQSFVKVLNSNGRAQAAAAKERRYIGEIRLPSSALAIDFPGMPGETFAAMDARAHSDVTAAAQRGKVPAPRRRYVIEIPSPSTGSGSRPQGEVVIDVDGDATIEQTARSAVRYPATPNDQAARAKWPSVLVGVWDKVVDDQHCDFRLADGTSVIRYPEAGAHDQLRDNGDLPPTPASATPCSAVRYSLRSDLDHGTGVAGVIAAQGRYRWVDGANPRALIWSPSLDKLLSGSGVWGPDPITKFYHDTGQHLSVINISADVGDKGRAPFNHIMFGDGGDANRTLWAKDIVLVAAAGDNGSSINVGAGQAPCPVQPACFDRSEGTALITVVALNAEGTGILRCKDIYPYQGTSDQCLGDPAHDSDKSATNYGDRFDVAAPGLAFTTMIGDGFGVGYGTSFASPRVTGLASMLIAKALSAGLAEPKALNVRMRILATADRIVDDGDMPLARYGRINFDRALAYEADTFVPRDEWQQLCDTPAKGCALSNLQLVRALPFTAVLDDGKAFEISWSQVIRLSALDQGYRYQVTYLDAPIAGVRAIRQATVTVPPKAQIRFRGPGHLYLIAAAQEFVSCAFVKDCPAAAP